MPPIGTKVERKVTTENVPILLGATRNVVEGKVIWINLAIEVKQGGWPLEQKVSGQIPCVNS